MLIMVGVGFAIVSVQDLNNDIISSPQDNSIIPQEEDTSLSYSDYYDDTSSLPECEDTFVCSGSCPEGYESVDFCSNPTRNLATGEIINSIQCTQCQLIPEEPDYSTPSTPSSSPSSAGSGSGGGGQEQNPLMQGLMGLLQQYMSPQGLSQLKNMFGGPVNAEASVPGSENHGGSKAPIGEGTVDEKNRGK